MWLGRMLLHGASLRLLTRSTSNLAGLEGLDAETVVGDLRQPGHCGQRLRAARRWCMLRRITGSGCRIPKEMYAANVDGTRELLQAGA